ncbi:hypothetical protein [Amaricoccus macauensis]|uniref:hypothetical protein n=1 Tax=Amaricoccus macauensis TaxID=57001 RepID=UPI003C7CA0CD
MRNLLFLAAGAALAACSGTPDLMSRNLETVALVDTGEEIVAPPLNFAHSTLRSFVPGEDGEEWQEVEGARCVASVGPYTAVVTTPVRLVVPDMRPVDMPLVATCTLAEFSGRAVFPSRSGFEGPYGSLSVGMKLAPGAVQ